MYTARFIYHLPMFLFIMDRLPLFHSASVSELSSLNTVDLEKSALEQLVGVKNENSSQITAELPDNPKRWSLARRILFYLLIFSLVAGYIVSLVVSLKFFIPIATDPESYKWCKTQIDESIINPTPSSASSSTNIRTPTKSEDILCSTRWRMLLARTTIAVWTSVTSAAIIAFIMRWMSEFMTLGMSACRKKGMTLTWDGIKAGRKTWERRYWFIDSWLVWNGIAFCSLQYVNCNELHDRYGYIW